MSWASLASNQVVSAANLADAVTTGIFAAKTSIPTSSPSRELTSTSATSYAYVDVGGGAASNQLVVKSDLTAAVVGPGSEPYYVYGVDGNTMYKSTNGGFTFTMYSSLPFGQNYTVVAASYNSQYLLAASNTINNTYYLSTDYGATFYSHNIPNVGSGYTFNTFYPYDADMSSDGQYMVIVGKTQPGTTTGSITIAVSSDYGTTFTAYYGQYYGGTGDGASVAISQNGAVVLYVGVNNSTGTSWRYRSTNYGSSFTFGGTSSNQKFYDVAMSYDGQYIIIVNKGVASTGNLFVSSNYGSTFPSRSTVGGVYWCGMTEDGSIMQVGGISGYINYSTNYGVTWNGYSQSPFYGLAGLSVGVLFTYPMVSNYVAGFQSTYCNYKPTGSSTTFYAQPLTYNYSINKTYRKAINY